MEGGINLWPAIIRRVHSSKVVWWSFDYLHSKGPLSSPPNTGSQELEICIDHLSPQIHLHSSIHHISIKILYTVHCPCSSVLGILGVGMKIFIVGFLVTYSMCHNSQTSSLRWNDYGIVDIVPLKKDLTLVINIIAWNIWLNNSSCLYS